MTWRRLGVPLELSSETESTWFTSAEHNPHMASAQRQPHWSTIAHLAIAPEGLKIEFVRRLDAWTVRG